MRNRPQTRGASPAAKLNGRGGGVRAAQVARDAGGREDFRITMPANSHDSRAAAPSPATPHRCTRCRGRRSILGSDHMSRPANVRPATRIDPHPIALTPPPRLRVSRSSNRKLKAEKSGAEKCSCRTSSERMSRGFSFRVLRVFRGLSTKYTGDTKGKEASRKGLLHGVRVDCIRCSPGRKIFLSPIFLPLFLFWLRLTAAPRSLRFNSLPLNRSLLSFVAAGRSAVSFLIFDERPRAGQSPWVNRVTTRSQGAPCAR